MGERLKVNEMLKEINIDFYQFRGGTFLVFYQLISSNKQLDDAIQFYKGDIARTEWNCNRFFIAQNFFSEYFPTIDYTNDDLLIIARAFASELSDRLKASFPEKSFSIEIIGDNFIDKEPLELSVTFQTKI
ncbi:MAG: hypothetical protein HC916_04110 [Coleofasciculaceae cyanobacterium SM2_1_6]|nr:hypothetical protein [Coleofasciculaceae cyanobacterium SM2_1_6]